MAREIGVFDAARPQLAFEHVYQFRAVRHRPPPMKEGAESRGPGHHRAAAVRSGLQLARDLEVLQVVEIYHHPSVDEVTERRAEQRKQIHADHPEFGPYGAPWIYDGRSLRRNDHTSGHGPRRGSAHAIHPRQRLLRGQLTPVGRDRDHESGPHWNLWSDRDQH